MDKPEEAPRQKQPVGRIWILLIIVLLGTLWIGVGDFRGAASDPDLVEGIAGVTWVELQSEQPRVAHLIDFLSKLIGALWIGFSLLGLAVVYFGLRQGLRWAWIGLWAVPFTMLLFSWVLLTTDLVAGAPTPPAVYSAPAIALLFAIGLLSTAGRMRG